MEALDGRIRWKYLLLVVLVFLALLKIQGWRQGRTKEL